MSTTLYTPTEQRAITRALNIIREKQLDYDGHELTCADATKDYCSMMLADDSREQFMVMFLNSQHKVIKSEILFNGTINAASVYPRVIIGKTLANNAAAVIIAHNHPSGEPEPSHADRRLTSDLKDALKVIDVPLLDHIVVGNGKQGKALSFAQRGLM